MQGVLDNVFRSFPQPVLQAQITSLHLDSLLIRSRQSQVSVDSLSTARTTQRRHVRLQNTPLPLNETLNRRGDFFQETSAASIPQFQVMPGIV